MTPCASASPMPVGQSSGQGAPAGVAAALVSDQVSAAAAKGPTSTGWEGRTQLLALGGRWLMWENCGLNGQSVIRDNRVPAQRGFRSAESIEPAESRDAVLTARR